MDKIQMENGIVESTQYLCWSKLFYSVALFQEGQTYKAVTELETTIKDYSICLEGDIYHPYLDNFYSQLGNMAFKI